MRSWRCGRAAEPSPTTRRCSTPACRCPRWTSWLCRARRAPWRTGACSCSTRRGAGRAAGVAGPPGAGWLAGWWLVAGSQLSRCCRAASGGHRAAGVAHCASCRRGGAKPPCSRPNPRTPPCRPQAAVQRGHQRRVWPVAHRRRGVPRGGAPVGGRPGHRRLLARRALQRGAGLAARVRLRGRGAAGGGARAAVRQVCAPRRPWLGRPCLPVWTLEQCGTARAAAAA
jgi:hypothetical protein